MSIRKILMLQEINNCTKPNVVNIKTEQRIYFAFELL